MTIAYLICGAVLLVAGRRLYWLLVAAVGFGAGALLAQEFFPGGVDAPNSWMAFAIAILGGIAGAILAVLFQKVAVALAGAAAGGFFGWTLFEAMGAESFAWIGLIIGAVLGGILVLKLFDWGLIVASSLAGAGFVIDGVQLEKSTEGWLLVAAFLFGLLVQGVQLARARRKKETRRPQEES